MVFRADGTVILLHQIFGNGQADAVSAFILVVGFVFPVKAFKESGIIDIFTCRIVVGYGKTYAAAAFSGKRDPDGAAGITVFDGVVYKQGTCEATGAKVWTVSCTALLISVSTRFCLSSRSCALVIMTRFCMRPVMRST